VREIEREREREREREKGEGEERRGEKTQRDREFLYVPKVEQKKIG
jgi:hypothetical protein